MDRRLLALAIQRSLAGMEHRRNRNGCTDESRPGAAKTVRYFYSPVAKGYGSFPGQRFKGILATGRRTKRRHCFFICRPWTYSLCCNGGICTLDVLREKSQEPNSKSQINSKI